MTCCEVVHFEHAREVCGHPHPEENESASHFVGEEPTKALLRFLYRQDWMNNGGPMQRNAVAMCATFRIQWLMGKLLTSADSANISQDIPFG